MFIGKKKGSSKKFGKNVLEDHLPADEHHVSQQESADQHKYRRKQSQVDHRLMPAGCGQLLVVVGER